jgi:GT2 family glycosyltransferase
MSCLPDVGAVVIGRNEGKRLGDSLAALRGKVAHVVYADSSSTDGSRELAREQGAQVAHLETGPYTPSRGRQVGFEALIRERQQLKYVQFIDGDCILDPDWLGKAHAFLEAHPEAAAVFGRRREERCGQSLFSRVIDVDWDHPAGEAANFGGDALVRIEALEKAGGWSINTINAEDIDLSFRIRALGGKIVRLPDAMTLHDIRMTRFSEYWRRGVRSGYGFAEVGLRHRRGPGKMLLRRMVSGAVYALLLPLLAAAGAIWYWPLLAIVALLYLRLFWTLAARCRRRGGSLGTAIAYGAFNLACKWANAIGSARYFLDCLRGRKAPSDHLIIYRHQGSPDRQESCAP